MSAAVHFEDRALGRIEALFGVVAIGCIIPLDHPKHRVAWRFFLPPGPQSPRPASDTEAAKRAIERCAQQWLEAAGLS